jgi:hypothetical protein
MCFRYMFQTYRGLTASYSCNDMAHGVEEEELDLKSVAAGKQARRLRNTLDIIDVLTSITTLAAMTAMRTIMFITRRILRMM